MNDVEWKRSVEQRLRELNQKAKPSRRAAVGGGGGGGTTETLWYEAPTKAELQNDSSVPRTSWGLVNAGDDNGMVCVRNPDNDGWDAINVLE